VAITFTPTASGVSSGSFTISDGVGTQTASLIGTGVTPATDALSATSLAFAAQKLTSVSSPQQITLTNAGDVALTLISAQTTSTDFTITNACGASLNPHSTCAIDVAFQPQSIGHIAAQFTIADVYRTQTVALSGTGLAPPGVSFSPLYNLTFPITGVGQTATPQTVTLTNNGGLPLNLTSTVLTGDFSILAGSDTCGVTLAAANACTLQIVFAPTVGGTRTGTLTITDSAPNSPQVLHLSGNAVDFAFTPDGATTATISSGENAVFPLLFTSSTADTTNFTCSGAPLNATCNVTPASVGQGGATTVSVTVLTGTLTASLAPPEHSSRNTTLWLAALLPLGLLTLRRRRLLSLLVLCCLLLPTGCGTGRQLPSSGSTGGSTGQIAVTPAGTYPIVVSAISGGLTRTITLTLVVR
ncbi:MAG: choice-of-anchor D domain-containing protein, partial [Edaphobacter sp.]